MTGVRVVLRTNCGCERVVEVQNPYDTWNAAILPRETAKSFLADGPGDASLPITVLARQFKWAGKRAPNGDPVLEEMGVAECRRPERVPFTDTEWADATARAHRVFGTGGDLPTMDAEFLRRHDGANIVAHKSGALMGAWYPAPGWQNSAEAVAIFSALRSLGAP